MITFIKSEPFSAFLAKVVEKILNMLILDEYIIQIP